MEWKRDKEKGWGEVWLGIVLAWRVTTVATDGGIYRRVGNNAELFNILIITIDQSSTSRHTYKYYYIHTQARLPSIFLFEFLVSFSSAPIMQTSVEGSAFSHHQTKAPNLLPDCKRKQFTARVDRRFDKKGKAWVLVSYGSISPSLFFLLGFKPLPPLNFFFLGSFPLTT